MKILGISDAHNASACVVEDGVVTAALQEERLTRVKNDHRFPERALEWVLRHTGTSPDQLDHIAFSSFYSQRPYTAEDLLQWYGRLGSPTTQVRRLARRTPAWRLKVQRRRAERLDQVRRLGLPVDRTSFIDHHTCHAAAAYHGSGWDTGPVLVMTADGEGDGVAASVRVGSDGRLQAPLAIVPREDSLGAVYSTITHLLGMVPLEHEYKVMGLAPYAPAKGAERSYRVFRGMLEFCGPQGLSWRRARGWPDLFYSQPKLAQRLRFHRFDWISAGLQRFVEEHMVEWTRRAVAATGIRRLALSGGLYMNVKVNKLIAELDEVDEVFVFPSCGDETNAMGAAFHVHALAQHAAARPTAIPALGPIYWGSAPRLDRDSSELAALEAKGYRVDQPDDIEDAVADLLARGEVVARCKNRAEFGARALGNRSILADPTQPGVVKTINEMIKSRDFWMPFAPAMLAEAADKYLVNPKNLFAPYMILAFDTTEHVADFPAAVHPYDLTARPQMVTREHNPSFHHLIERFQQRTGRAVVLNTSFNLHGLPIVETAADAIHVLEESGLQHLALDRHLISKPGARPEATGQAE